MRAETDWRTRPSAGQSLTPVYAVRGNLIASSLEGLRQFSHFDLYLSLLDPKWREEVLFCLATSWAPVELAEAHYAAHDACALSSPELIEVCDFVSERVAGSFMSSLLRNSRTQQVDVCPWVPLREYRRLCERLLQGGCVSMQASGNREAVLEISDVSLLRFVAFKQTLLGLTRHAVRGFACRAFVRELAATGDRLAIQVRWL